MFIFMDDINKSNVTENLSFLFIRTYHIDACCFIFKIINEKKKSLWFQKLYCCCQRTIKGNHSIKVTEWSKLISFHVYVYLLIDIMRRNKEASSSSFKSGVYTHSDCVFVIIWLIKYRQNTVINKCTLESCSRLLLSTHCIVNLPGNVQGSWKAYDTYPAPAPLRRSLTTIPWSPSVYYRYICMLCWILKNGIYHEQSQS